ncbi:MAG: major capsid protein, partial [Gemmatimonas sp.]
VPNILKGDYKKEAFFKDVANIVSRRDSTSTADVTDLALTQGENIGIKLDRKVGPVAQALNAMRKAGLTEESASRAFGEIAAKRKVKDMVNAAVIAVEAAISGTASLNLDITGETNKNISVAALNRALLPFGDDAQGIVIWLAHSKINNDLVGSLIASSVTGLADVASLQGSVPQWLGRPALITDAPALWDLNGSLVDTYNTLGLTEGAVLVEESEEESFVTEIVTGKEQLARRWQSEHAFTVSIKGYKWNTVTGTNPTDAALGTSSNWIRTYSDDKALAGVRLVTR